MRARDNPFAVDRVLAVRYKPQGWTWEALLSRLKHLRYRAPRSWARRDRAKLRS